MIATVESKRMRWSLHVARMGERRNYLKFLVRKSEGKRLLGRRKRKWKDDIEIDLRGEKRYAGVDWIHLAEDRVQ